MIDGVAYLAGAESSSTFMPTSYGQAGRSGCRTVTNGVLSNGAGVTWNSEVPLGSRSACVSRVGLGVGSVLMDGDPTAVLYVFLGVLFDGVSALLLVHLVKLGRNWLRPVTCHVQNEPFYLPRAERAAPRWRVTVSPA